MRVIGVDPGVARTGIAIVDAAAGELRLCHAACVDTESGANDGDRLATLFCELERLLASYRPDSAAVEQIFFATNRRSAMRVSQARGVVLCALARAGVAVAEYTPLQVKEAVTGWARADKSQVSRMTRALLHVDDIPGPDDVTDACAVALCHHHRARLAAATRRRRINGVAPRLADAIARASSAAR